MKILQIIDALAMGGAENLVYQLCLEYKMMGHQVDVLGLTREKDSVLDTKFREAGITPIYVSGTTNLLNPMLIYRIIPYLKGYDIVHVHLFPALYWVGIANLISYQLPLVYTEHSTFNKRRSKRVLHLIDKWIYKHCYKRIISCSEEALLSFKRSFPSLDISNINNGVNTLLYRDAKPISRGVLSVPEDAFVIIMVASFRYPKRQDVIVKALSKTGNNVHLLLVGAGDTQESVCAIASNEGCEDRVHFLGIRSDVPSLLKTSDVVCMSSEYEGLSLSSIEGMASGKPFVASNVVGLKEIVGGYGLLFENGDSDGLADVINKLQKDCAFNERVVTQCLKRASEFDINKVANQYLSVYSELIRRN